MSLRLYVPRLVVALFASIAVLTGNVYGQEVSQPETQNTPTVDLPKLFTARTKALFQEKIYVHQDKDSYMTQETMWMRAYRTDASTLSPYYYSGLMYIEIRDPENNMKHRMQINRVDSVFQEVFQASFKIPSDWPSGYYELVAYTNLMQNFSDDFYFKKRFYIFNPSDYNTTTDISYTPQPDKKTVDVKIKLKGVDGEPYKGVVVDVTPFVNGRKRNRITRLVDKDGAITLDYKQDEKITGLQIKFQEDEPIRYERYFKVPILRDSIDVQFMPEGGHLLAGVQQQIGFKAVGADGKSVDVKGQITDSLGNMAGFFESQHLGMGRFMLQAQSGAKYSAEVTTEDGRSFKFPLPMVADTGVVISTSIRNNVLTCRVQGTPDYDYTGLGLVVHSRGRPIRWANLQSETTLQLPLSSLPEGILQCFIVDQAGTVLSERVVLINKDQSPDVKVSGIQPSYGRRQKVALELDVTYGGTQPLPADLSVAVIDAKSTVMDKSENIVSYLQMSSDIKGKVENAAYYFDKSIPLREREAKADILMMTQAWKRFDVDSIFRGKMPNMPFTVEPGQYVAGKIKSLWGSKPVDRGTLTLYGINPNPPTQITLLVEADSTGFFEASGISFPRNTTFIVQANQKGNKKNVEVIMEEQRFAGIKADPLAGRYIYKPEEMTEDSISKFYMVRGIKHHYDENGQRVYTLEEATVTAPKDEEADFSDIKITGEKLIEEGYSEIRDWLESQGLMVREDGDMGETVYIRNARAGVRVDNKSYEHQEMLRIPVQEIKEIKVLKDPISWASEVLDANSDSGQGGIKITTKSGMGMSGVPKETNSFLRFRPLGFSVPAKFYVPKYDGTDNATNYDDRVTVHWDPKVKTDMSGKAKVEFYTTDATTEYLIVIQGMAGSQTMGMPIYKEATIKSGM